MKSAKTLVRDTLSASTTLKNTYEVYQILLYDIKKKDHIGLKKHFERFFDSASEYMQTAMKTLIENYEYVENALKYNYSNGFTEGINNFIKVLKRIAFGYRSFFHFRNRILITCSLKKNIG